MSRFRAITITVAAFAAVLLSQTANAAPITFTFTATGAGTLVLADGTETEFGPSTLIEATIVTDTSELQDPIINPINGQPLPGVIGYGEGTTVSASLTLAGVPLGALANPAYVFRNDDLVGFGDLEAWDIFGAFSNAFLGYDLTSSLGPISGSPYGPPFFLGSGFPVALASGDALTLRGLSQVTVLAEVQAVPEPAALLLIMSGLAAFGFRRAKA